VVGFVLGSGLNGLDDLEPVVRVVCCFFFRHCLTSHPYSPQHRVIFLISDDAPDFLEHASYIRSGSKLTTHGKCSQKLKSPMENHNGLYSTPFEFGGKKSSY
jgi:hypothetical protein